MFVVRLRRVHRCPSRASAPGQRALEHEENCTERRICLYIKHSFRVIRIQRHRQENTMGEIFVGQHALYTLLQGQAPYAIEHYIDLVVPPPRTEDTLWAAQRRYALVSPAIARDAEDIFAHETENDPEFAETFARLNRQLEHVIVQHLANDIM